MRMTHNRAFWHPASGGPGDAVLLGRLGAELADIYRDTLHAPLPAGLKAIVSRLDAVLLRHGCDRCTLEADEASR